VKNLISNPEAKMSAVLRNPWRYFFITLIVCFLLGLVSVSAAVGADRRICPDWSNETFVLFGIGLSFAYAAFLSFVCVGCMLVIVCNKSGRIKRLLRFAGFVPLTVPVTILLFLHYGGGDSVARLKSLLPIMYGIGIVYLLGFVLLSCFGWKHYANMKRGEQDASSNGDKHFI
jgi:ABC-type Fe3+ transport system permease subunit